MTQLMEAAPQALSPGGQPIVGGIVAVVTACAIVVARERVRRTTYKALLDKVTPGTTLVDRRRPGQHLVIMKALPAGDDQEQHVGDGSQQVSGATGG